MNAKYVSSILLLLSVFYLFWHACFSCKAAKINLIRRKVHYQQSLIEVNVSGDVSSPGIYLHQPGVTVKEVIVTAGLLTKINSKSVNVNHKIFTASVVKVAGSAVLVDAVKESGSVR